MELGVLELETNIHEVCSFTITDKAPGRKRLLSAFTVKTLCSRGVNPQEVHMKLDCQCNYHKGKAALRHYDIVQLYTLRRFVSSSRACARLSSGARHQFKLGGQSRAQAGEIKSYTLRVCGLMWAGY